MGKQCSSVKDGPSDTCLHDVECEPPLPRQPRPPSCQCGSLEDNYVQMACRMIGHLANHLPTGSFFSFELLSGLSSCKNKALTSMLVSTFGAACLLSCFTDSFRFCGQTYFTFLTCDDSSSGQSCSCNSCNNNNQRQDTCRPPRRDNGIRLRTSSTPSHRRRFTQRSCFRIQMWWIRFTHALRTGSVSSSSGCASWSLSSLLPCSASSQVAAVESALPSLRFVLVVVPRDRRIQVRKTLPVKHKRSDNAWFGFAHWSCFNNYWVLLMCLSCMHRTIKTVPHEPTLSNAIYELSSQILGLSFIRLNQSYIQKMKNCNVLSINFDLWWFGFPFGILHSPRSTRNLRNCSYEFKHLSQHYITLVLTWKYQKDFFVENY